MRLGHSRTWSAVLTLGTVLALTGLTSPGQAATVYEYTDLNRASMKAVKTDSVETQAEGANGPLAKVLDGDTNSYWHTKYTGTTDKVPHYFVIDLGSSVQNLGRVTLTPRQSSNNSGRVGNYEVDVSTDAKCAVADTADTATFTKVKEGTIEATPTTGSKSDPVNITFTPTTARCVKVIYKTAWGGDNSSQDTATLAEFAAATAVAKEVPDQPEGDGPQIVVPTGAPSITDGVLTIHTHPNFPQVVDYQLGDKKLAGKFGDAIKSVTINGKATPVSVAQPVVAADGHSVTYTVTPTGFTGAKLDVTLSVADQTLTYTIKITDPNKAINTVLIPDLDLVSLNGKDAKAQIMAASVETNREKAGDTIVNVSQASDNASGHSFMVAASNSDLAAGFETTSISNNNVSRFIYAVKTGQEGQNVATISPDTWTHRSQAVQTYDTGDGIGVDPDPVVKVKIVADANKDGAVDWQDSAIATRDILTPINGAEDVKNYVVMRIPFNITSQATHPFLRTLDDTKRISLATDNLGQEVLLKGYQAEGHDSAQGDYGNNYNERAGGLKDLKTLVEKGKDWNATFGIHVNATETYSEANCFSDGTNGYKDDQVAAPCEISMPPAKAWGWMNQAYSMNNQKDLATGNVLKRLEQLREDFPVDSNLNWLYWDVYSGVGWQGDRFSSEMQKQGWRLSSEWAHAMPRFSTWSHWATDENYGSADKGLTSQLIRFVENSYRDTFNPDPMLGNADVVEFEGWTGHVDYNAFIKNVWERNLPVKFLQQSDIMTWTDHKITFENGTTVTSDLDTIAGNVIPTDRTITYDGATVFDQGDYLLPWTNGGQARLYYWNPGNEAKTWKLTNAWAKQTSLKLYKLTDTGKVEVQDVAVTNGSVSLPATEANTAYVLYPASDVPAAKTPNWGEGSNINDPGFFSGTTKSYQTTGAVTVEKTARGNFQAQLGEGKSSIAQQITLPAGSYSAWAWIEIQPGKTRSVSVKVAGQGITLPPAQTGKAGEAVTTIHSSSEINKTASDEKFQTYFQRVPVHFTTDGKAFTFSVEAGDDSAATVAIDDLRVVQRDTPDDEGKVPGTVVFEDFEDVDTGYYPFVTGSTQSGDARTQLAKRHAPYSQAGWYGIVKDSGQGVQGQKYTDNVLDGQWSLLAHQENPGLILRTTQGTVPLQKGHSYKVTFDYQAGFDGGYAIVLGHDQAGENGWSEVIDQNWNVKEARGTGWSLDGVTGKGTQVFEKTFAVTSDNPTFLGVKNILGGSGNYTQNDLAIDNFRVVDLGKIPYVELSGEATTADNDTTRALTLTSQVSVPEGTASDVKHEIAVPEGWTLTKVKDAATSASATAPSVATWKLTMPKNAKAAEVTFTGTWMFNGKEGTGSTTLNVDPGNFPLINPIGGDQLIVVEKDSEQTGNAEPAPNGPAAAAIDGNPNTYWHTKWSGGEDKYPHHIVLQPKAASQDPEMTCTMTGFEYTARQNAENGRAKGYEIYVSKDGKTWGDPVASGDFANVATPQVIEFPKPVEGSFVKLVETSAQNNANFGGAGELRLGGLCTTPGESVEVTPAAVDFVDKDGTRTYTIPTTEGVQYLIDGKAVKAGTYDAKPGQTVKVSAQALAGYVLSASAQPNWTFTFSKEGEPGGSQPTESGNPSGEATEPAGPTESSQPSGSAAPTGTDSSIKTTKPADKTQSGLVNTGATVAGLGAVAAILLALGAASLTRRKQQ